MTDKNDKKEFLFSLKREIEKNEKERANLQGELSAFLKRLKNEFKISGVDELRKKIAELEKQVKDNEKKIEAGIDELKEKYELG